MNLYLILGLGREARTEDVKRAYRRLARKYHPDINPGDRAAAERFRRISEAYAILVDPERRRRYDAHGEVSAEGVESRFEFAGFDFTLPHDEARASTFGELFADVLHPAAARAGQREPERGADLHATLELSFEEAGRGARRLLTVTRLERCAACHGDGHLRGPDALCPMCDGAGHVRGARGHMVFSRVCPTCAGEGRVRHRVCAACGGEGVGACSTTVAVDVPAGVPDGVPLTVPGEGHAGRRGGPAGDLRLAITVHPHPFFRRVGDDLLVEVPVAVHEAALGARIDVPSLDGPVRLRVPPGTQSGQTFRLRERGFPSLRDARRGDLVVTVRIVLPPVLDERSKQLLHEFGQLNQGNVRQALGV